MAPSVRGKVGGGERVRVKPDATMLLEQRYRLKYLFADAIRRMLAGIWRGIPVL
ncbi:MAG TPA: hypothetical protein VIU29_02040 [Candidatus Deferrimicrobiaceae bacterium]